MVDKGGRMKDIEGMGKSPILMGNQDLFKADLTKLTIKNPKLHRLKNDKSFQRNYE